MTHKDYELLAAAFARSRPTLAQYTTHSAVGDNTLVDHISYDAAYHAWTVVVVEVSDALGRDNPRFDRSRFQFAATKEA